MKKLFYFGCIGLLLFEIANVYFIMPMPGSQEMPSLGLAYFLYRWRWGFRVILGLMALAGLARAWQGQRWLVLLLLLSLGGVSYMTHFEMAADTMFYQPGNLLMKPAADNKVPAEKLVIGIHLNGQARAYPIQYIGYHHQVLDTLAGVPLMVTYCTVCRSGRVFQPLVQGQPERFRLVGMDHFNAMFEDAGTHSWWRQVSGEAVAGPLKGAQLPEIFSEQMSLGTWFALHPNSLVMQPDPAFADEYADMDSYDTGKGRGSLTRTDSLSWQRKSWVIGVAIGQDSKAFDWNRLLRERIIRDKVGATPIALVLASDNKSFFALERPAPGSVWALNKDTLLVDGRAFSLDGRALDAGTPLKRAQAYQEFWHSWQTFHPATEK